MRCWQCKERAHVVIRIKTANGEQSVCRKCKNQYFPDLPALDKFGKEPNIPMCPQCDKPLHKRKNRRTGAPFMGCSGYPQCTYTRPVWGVVRTKPVEGEPPAENGSPPPDTTGGTDHATEGQ